MAISAWVKASRLQSQSYIFLPILFGQAWYVSQGGKLNWAVFAVLHLFGLLNQLYIVYANDYADQETDRKNETYNMFSGGSRVLVDGDISPRGLMAGAVFMAVLCLLCGGALTAFYHRWWAVPIIAAGLLLLWMYSYPPVRMSYRGGGELLQMLGVGLVLPVLGYYGQSGSLVKFPWLMLLVTLPTHLACGMATSLPDGPSDEASGKRTATVVLGVKTTQVVIVLLNLASIGAFLVVGWLPLGNLTNLWILALPTAATVAQLAFFGSKPGSTRLTVLVALAVFSTLSLMGSLSVALFIK